MVRTIDFIKKFIFSILYVFVAYTFYRFLYYQLENVDEVNYLSDSLLLLRVYCHPLSIAHRSLYLDWIIIFIF